MRVLVVSATEMEIAPVVEKLDATPGDRDTRLRSGAYRGCDVDVLVTGVGMVATAAWCSRALAQARYDLALNCGICGSFDPVLRPGRVVHVVADRMAELGAEDGDAFLSVEELKLLDEDEFPFSGGQLLNAMPPVNSALDAFPAVAGITVNTVHGNRGSIDAAVARFNPQVESMEGAAFMYSCLLAGVPFAQIRAVSNMVEPRNRAAWNIAGAIEHLGRAVLSVFDRA